MKLKGLRNKLAYMNLKKGLINLMKWRPLIDEGQGGFLRFFKLFFDILSLINFLLFFV